MESRFYFKNQVVSVLTVYNYANSFCLVGFLNKKSEYENQIIAWAKKENFINENYRQIKTIEEYINYVSDYVNSLNTTSFLPITLLYRELYFNNNDNNETKPVPSKKISKLKLFFKILLFKRYAKNFPIVDYGRDYVAGRISPFSL